MANHFTRLSGICHTLLARQKGRILESKRPSAPLPPSYVIGSKAQGCDEVNILRDIRYVGSCSRSLVLESRNLLLPLRMHIP